MSMGTALRDAGDAAPAYDFVAPVRQVAKPSVGGNPAFRGSSNSAFTGGPIVELGVPLVPGYLPDKAPGLSQAQKAILSALLTAVLLAVTAYVGSMAWQAYRAHQRAQQIDATMVSFPS